MNDTQSKVDEPRMDESETYRTVLQDGESIQRGEIKDVKIVRLGPKGEDKTAAGSQNRDGGGNSKDRKIGLNLIKLDEKQEREKTRASKKTQKDVLRKDLDNSVFEGVFTNASSSIINSYSTPFALSLNATNAEIGILNSFQNLAGIISQVPGARLIRYMSRKKVWSLCTILSRVFLLPLIFIGLFLSGSFAVWLTIGILCLVSFFSTMKSPAWSSMMGDIVPQNIRGRYFGKRNMIIGAAGMLATIASGVLVFYLGFSVIFFIAVLLSAFSILFFIRISEPKLSQERMYHYRINLNLSDLVCQIKLNKNFAVFTIYMFVVNFGVNIGAPFIAVYMLKDMNIGYGSFAVLVSIGALIQIVSMKYWGNMCDRYGTRKILVVSGILICFIPLWYMFSSNVWHLVLVKIYDGFVWGCFDLVVFNYLLSVTPPEKRPGFVANHNLIAGAGTVIGALFGAYLSQHLESGYLLLSGIQAVFLVSFFVRVCSLVLLAKIPDVEAKEYVPVRYVFWESVAVGPAKGIEHAITNAFRYPYGVKIKSILGLNNSRIKISKKNFHREEREAKNRFAAERIFAHLGVSPIKISPRDSYPAGLKKEGVHKMALGERMKRQEDGNEYVELNIEQQSPKTAKIVVHSLQRFSETDRIAKSIRANNIVFVGLKTMKQTNMDELKQAVAKINKICVQNGSSISLVDDEWLIIAPQNAAIA